MLCRVHNLAIFYQKCKITILVPYSMACSVWKVPFFPVMPWQMTRVFLSTKTAAGGGGVVPKERDFVRDEGYSSDDELATEERSLEGRDPRSFVTCLDMAFR